VDLELAGKTALVTAASRGIGRAVACRLANEGMTVVAGARSADRQEEEHGTGRILPRFSDLADKTATEKLVASVVDAHGRLDVLVINTPGPKIMPVLSTSWDDWAAAHELLLRPVVQLALAGAAQMREQGGGTILLLSSTWVRQPAPGGVLSSSYRSAASLMLKTLSREVAGDGVRVLQVMPGATSTERMQNIVSAKAAAHGSSNEAEIAEIVAAIPLGRWAEPEEIADVVAFAASPRAGFMTGSILTVDGGAVAAAN